MDGLTEKCNTYMTEQEREDLWDQLLADAVSSHWPAAPDTVTGHLLPVSCNSQVANVLGSHFLSVIEDQCSACNDEPGRLLDFLASERGLRLLVLLNVYGSKLTTCCNELCDLLLSIIPLTFKVAGIQGKSNPQFHAVEHAGVRQVCDETFSYCSDPGMVKPRYQRFALEYLDCFRFPNETSSVNAHDFPAEISTGQGSANFVTSLHSSPLSQCQLFNLLLSTYINIAQNEVLSKDVASQLAFVSSSLRLLCTDDSFRQLGSLEWYQCYGIMKSSVALLYGVCACPDTLGKLTSASPFKQLLCVCRSILQCQGCPSVDHACWTSIGVDCVNSIIQCCLKLLGNDAFGGSLSVDFYLFISSLVDHGLLNFLKSVYVQVDWEIAPSSNEDAVTAETNSSLSMDELTSFADVFVNGMTFSPQFQVHCEVRTNFALLVKLCKRLTDLKYCTSLDAASSSSDRRRTLKTTSRRLDAFNLRSSSSDEKSGGKTNLRNIDHDRGEASAEDMSDYLTKFSDSDLERSKEVRLKSEKAALKKGTTPCFIAKVETMLVESFAAIHESFLQENLLQAALMVGVCPCVDLDGLLTNLISTLDHSIGSIVEKTLVVMTHLASVHSDMLTRKYGSSTLKNSGKQTVIDPPLNGDVSLSLNDAHSLKFFVTCKSFLMSPSFNFKSLLIRHMKTLAASLPATLQKDLFSKVIFPSFRSLFPTEEASFSDILEANREKVESVKGHLDVMLTCLRHDDILVMFHDLRGLVMLETLAVHGDTSLASLALDALEHLAWFHSSYMKASFADHAGSQSVQVKPNSKIRFALNVSLVAEAALKALANLLENCLSGALDNLPGLFGETGSPVLLQLLQIVCNIFPENNFFQEEFIGLGLDSMCLQLFDGLVAWMEKKLEQQLKGNGEHVTESEDFLLEISKLLNWLSVILPLSLQSVDRKNSPDRKNSVAKMKSSFLHETVLLGRCGEQICLTLVEAAVVCRRKPKHIDQTEKAGHLCGLMIAGEAFDQEAANDLEESCDEKERGYDADRESDSDKDVHSPLATKPHSYLRASRLRSLSSGSIKQEDVSNKHNGNLKVTEPWMCTFVLNFLANAIKRAESEDVKEKHLQILHAVLDKILEYLLASWQNVLVLSTEGLLNLLLQDLGCIFTNDISEELHDTLGKMIVCLSAYRTSAIDFQNFLKLFQQPNCAMACLSTIFLKMVEVAVKNDGPTCSLSFPILFDENSVVVVSKPSLHQNQTFMIPKTESRPSRSRLRSQSWSSKYEAVGSTLKPIGYSIQPPALDVAPIQMRLQSTFLWPDREFSISVWFLLEDNTVSRLVERQERFGSTRSRRAYSLPLYCYNEVWCEYGCEELFHLFSFGSGSAVFEVWVGARTGHLQYRWIVSNINITSDDQFVTFDQVTVPHAACMNVWHHIVVSLVLPRSGSPPHTSEILTFVDGCDQPSVQMKYPSQWIDSLASLTFMMGHAIHSKQVNGQKQAHAQHVSDRVLKTGIAMVFQGKAPAASHSPRQVKRLRSSVIDKIKAVYLFSLGPNCSRIAADGQEYFTSQAASHMDSSLNWDSMIFKELSFCMSIISERLVSSKFPMELLEEKVQILPDVQASLQDCLLVIYNPRRENQFLQFAPELKKTGSIHQLYTPDSTMSRLARRHNDGAAIDASLLGDMSINKPESLQDAVHSSGGIAVLLYLHALVASFADSQIAQAAVLRAIFLVQDKCPYLLREMNDMAGYFLINRTLRMSPCRIDSRIMKALIESFCDGEVFIHAEPEKTAVNMKTTAVVKNVCILQMLLTDWNLMANSSYEVEEVLWRVLERLVRPDHPHKAFNIPQFQRARVVENMLMGCQERQQGISSPLPLLLCDLYIGVICNLLGQPPDLPVLKAMCSFLIAIHPTLDTLTLHSSKNFYLIARPIASVKSEPSIAGRNHEDKAHNHRLNTAFCEADVSSRTGQTPSPSVMSSHEDFAYRKDSWKFPQSEVIFRRDQRPSISAFSEATDNLSVTLNISSSVADANLSGYQNGTLPKVTSTAIEATDGDSKKCESSIVVEQAVADVDPGGSQRYAVSAALETDRAHPTVASKLPHLGMKSGHRKNRSLELKVKLLSATESHKSHAVGIISGAADPQDYDIISDSDFASSVGSNKETEEFLVVDGFLEQKMESFTPSTSEDASNDQASALYYLRLGLMKLIKSTLTSLPDNLVTRVFGTILKVEHLLVLVNQANEKLRELALQNLCLYLQRGGRDCIDNFKRFMGYHLLANQIHQYPVTAPTIDCCVSLLAGKSLQLTHETFSVHDLSFEPDIICPHAIVPCLTLIEGTIQRPRYCGLIVAFLIKVFDEVESLPLFAFDHGLGDIICSVISVLNADPSSVNASWKRESFGHILQLIDWLVGKACCTCQSAYFEMYKDLELSLDFLEAKEKEKEGALFPQLYKCIRFLKYYLIQAALNVFQTAPLYSTAVSSTAKSDVLVPSFDPQGTSVSTVAKQPSVARSLIQKIRGSVQVVTSPTVATPSEVKERFCLVLGEAVKQATLFNKGQFSSETIVFGHQLPKICSPKGTHPGISDGGATSMDADREFSKNLLDFFFQSVTIALESDPGYTSWAMLLRACKDDILLQANRFIMNVISPTRNMEVRLNFIHQVLVYKHSKGVRQCLMFGNASSKNRDSFLACLSSVLNIPQSLLNQQQVAELKEFSAMLRDAKIELVKINDQQLLHDHKEVRHKKRDQEYQKRKLRYKRIMERNSILCQNIAEEGMEVSKVIVEEQDHQRQRLLRLVRGNVSKDVEVRKTWRNMIYHLTQERAPWYDAASYPNSWQLDPTEGPCRMRRRLQRCHLEIPSKFFLAHAPGRRTVPNRGRLSFLFDEKSEDDKISYYSFKTNDTIRYLYHCVQVTPATKNSGEVLIGETHVYFVSDEILGDATSSQTAISEGDVISISWRYEEIREILNRRYSLQDNALEIFLTSGRTFLLAFEDTKSRDEVYKQLRARELPNLVTDIVNLSALTQRWRDGFVTNFEYLTELNKNAGRSFNDLMQYPVFPFILADYESAVLDLTEMTTFRNLMKPIACQYKSKEDHYVETYQYLKADYEQRKLIEPDSAVPPYHYSSHYSNSGTVLHFLVRLPPFTSMFLKYQDNQFDIPDRTFHSMKTTWTLSSFVSNTDVKELIPEFFFLPEFLMNNECFNLGHKQNGDEVSDVALPIWSKGDPRLFTLIHMQALESVHVSAAIHWWIDLVFGCKQTGLAAVKAVNVFHPSTYFGVDVTAVKDKIQQRALQTMIETYGQTPLQLFTSPHPKRFSRGSVSPFSDVLPYAADVIKSLPKEKASATEAEGMEVLNPLDSVIGLQWGDFCGSPVNPQYVVQWVSACSFPVHTIISRKDELTAFLCRHHVCLLAPGGISLQKSSDVGVLSWGYNDACLRVHGLQSSVKTVFDPMRPDLVTCCHYVPGSEILLIGGTSGVLNAWPVKYNPTLSSLDVVGAKQNLLGHSEAIVTLAVSEPYRFAVTGSKDCTAIIWGLNRLCYIRSLPLHESFVSCVAISDVSGDIATSCNSGAKGVMYLWTVNARLVGRVTTGSKINCLAFSCLPDGIAVNLLVCGLVSGVVRFWNSWTLSPVRDICHGLNPAPIVSLAYSKWDPQVLFAADAGGDVMVWTKKGYSFSKPVLVIVTAAE